jgi:hypothetical protein
MSIDPYRYGHHIGTHMVDGVPIGLGFLEFDHLVFEEQNFFQCIDVYRSTDVYGHKTQTLVARVPIGY